MKPMKALALGLAVLASTALGFEAASAHRLRAAPLRDGWGWGGATIGTAFGPEAPYYGDFRYGRVHYVYGYPYYGYASPCYLDQGWGPHGFRQFRFCP
jgi:hypothetical protein